MISKKEEKLLNELKELRFLNSDNDDEDEMEEEIEEKIERYESIIYELSKDNNIEIIPYLCDIAEDRATEASSVEYLVKSIVNIAMNNIEEGIKYIIKGTVSMIPKAYYKALFLHTLIIRDDNFKDYYIKSLNASSEEEKTIVKMLLLNLKRKKVDDVSVDYVLKNV